MSTVHARKVAAVVGAFVADAAAQPLHWMYNTEMLLKLTNDRPDVEFHDPPGNPFYRIETGKNSCYGDQAYVLLKSLIEQKGYNTKDYAEKTYHYFGPGTEYDLDAETIDVMALLYAEYGPRAPNSVYSNLPALPNAPFSDHSSQTQDTNRSVTSPISKPWKHTSLRHFAKNYTDGKEETGSETETAIDCVVKIIPLVAMYAGKADLMDKVAEAIRVTQLEDIAVATGMAAARILEQYILGHTEGVVEQVIKDLRDPSRLCPNELDNAMAAMLQKVVDVRSAPHVNIARHTFKIN